MVKHFLFKCKNCSKREVAIIPFDLTYDKQTVMFNEHEQDFIDKYKCPGCGKN